MLDFVRSLRALGRRLFRFVSMHDRRRRVAEERHFQQFAAMHGLRLAEARSAAVRTSTEDRKTAVVFGRIGRSPEAQVMLVTLLREAGYTPTVLLLRKSEEFLRPYYELAGVSIIEVWPTIGAERFLGQAEAMVRQCTSLRALLSLEFRGVRVGRSALSMTLRSSQVGLLDLDGEARGPRLISHLADALAAATHAGEALDRLAPTMTVSYEMEYTPKRELFDASLARGGTVVAAYRAPRRDALLLKRYSQTSQHRHPSSLSDASWRQVQHMAWTPAHRQELVHEVRACYEQGDWWGVPTRGNPRIAVAPEDLRARFGLDPARRTAFIFPHVPWDASFSWGEDLFADYQTWLVETVRAACDNPGVNWVVRVHPVNMGKSARVKDGTDSIEIAAIRQQLGLLPSHVVLVPPDSGVSTIALFGVMDYCLTVRGTVGLEAASLGIEVLTGGTGRYDRRGFTIDSDSTQQYLDRVRRIQDIPPMSAARRELAERFAYGMFVLRPLALEPALNTALMATDMSLTDACRLEPRVAAFTDWLRDPSAEDFLMPQPGGSSVHER